MGDTVEIAQQLLGKFLVRQLDNGELLAGRITEAEAYIGRCDKACHAYNYRRTERTGTMFGPPGHAYIYLIYGMHHCLNFVTEPEGEPSAVLIRAIEAVCGTETIRQLRYGNAEMTPYRRKNFMNGPGKVCQGLALTRMQNGVDLLGNTLYVCDSPADFGCADFSVPANEVMRTGTRIGVDYAEEAREFPWRFWLETEV